MGFLFGDILAVSKMDIAIIWLGGAIVFGILIAIWRPLFAATVNRELAEAEGMNPDRANMIFMLLMAAVIAISMKIVGVLLIMALLAACIGSIAVVVGLFGSLEWDTPAGPSIVVGALFAFIISLIVVPLAGLTSRLKTNNNSSDLNKGSQL
jgi:zinc transport system permease protein